MNNMLLLMAYLGFISLGLPDTLIGVAWPSLRESFQLPQSAIALIFLAPGPVIFSRAFLPADSCSAWASACF